MCTAQNCQNLINFFTASTCEFGLKIISMICCEFYFRLGLANASAWGSEILYSNQTLFISWPPCKFWTKTALRSTLLYQIQLRFQIQTRANRFRFFDAIWKWGETVKRIQRSFILNFKFSRSAVDRRSTPTTWKNSRERRREWKSCENRKWIGSSENQFYHRSTNKSRREIFRPRYSRASFDATDHGVRHNNKFSWCMLHVFGDKPRHSTKSFRRNWRSFWRWFQHWIWAIKWAKIFGKSAEGNSSFVQSNSCNDARS